MSILAICGSIGKSAILRPRRVSSPSSSSALSAYSCSIAVIMVCGGGGSIKSKLSRSFTPIALSMRIVDERFCRWMSGTGDGSISFWNACSVYSR